MPSSQEKWRRRKKILPPRYDEVEIDYKGKTAQRLNVKELTANSKTLNRTVVILLQNYRTLHMQKIKSVY
jgi:hypothetical protein